MTQLPERPFFIVGHPRSGTTLLRFILSSHPRIYIPGETGFIPFLGQDLHGQLGIKQVRELLARIARLNRSWDGLVQDVSAFYASVPEPRLCYVLDALYRLKIAGHDAVRWGDKTPTYVRYISLLSKIFSTAQFVHIIRDGRDTVVSAHSKWGRERLYMDPYYLLKNWVKNVERGREAGQKLGPDRYLEVRYRNLVGHPQMVIERVCEFLGETVHSDMLDHTQLARKQVGPAGHVEVRDPISAARVGRWKNEMSSFEKKMADHVAGPTLAALGYELTETGPFSTSERLRLGGLATKYLFTDSIRTVLTTLGLLTLNRGKRRR